MMSSELTAVSSGNSARPTRRLPGVERCSREKQLEEGRQHRQFLLPVITANDLPSQAGLSMASDWNHKRVTACSLCCTGHYRKTPSCPPAAQQAPEIVSCRIDSRHRTSLSSLCQDRSCHLAEASGAGAAATTSCRIASRTSCNSTQPGSRRAEDRSISTTSSASGFSGSSETAARIATNRRAW